MLQEVDTLSRLEKDIQAAICSYLRLRGHFFWRNNTVGVYDAKRKTYRKTQKYGLVGLPDILLLSEGNLIGIEVKSEKGKQSAAQKEIEKMFLENGAAYVLARTVDDVMEVGL